MAASPSQVPDGTPVPAGPWDRARAQAREALTNTAGYLIGAGHQRAQVARRAVGQPAGPVPGPGGHLPDRRAGSAAHPLHTRPQKLGTPLTLGGCH